MPGMAAAEVGHQWSRPACVRPTIAAAELFRLAGISAGLPVNELPEAADILLELADNKISSVAAEIFFLRHIFGCELTRHWRNQPRAKAARCICRIVRITEEKLTERDYIAVIDLRPHRIALAPPSRSAAG